MAVNRTYKERKKEKTAKKLIAHIERCNCYLQKIGQAATDIMILFAGFGTRRNMRKAISIESLVAALTNQRSYMLALSNTDLTEYQLSALLAVYYENEKLVNLLGIQVPTLTSIVQRHNEVIFLEKLYRSSPDEEGGTTIGIEATHNESKQQEISGVARMVSPEVGSNEA